MKNKFKFVFIWIMIIALVALIFVPVIQVAAQAKTAVPLRTLTVALTPEMLIAFAAAILAILFDWLPGLKGWYDKFKDGEKRGLMAVLLLLLTGAVFGLSCAGWLKVGWLCTGAGLEDAVLLLLLSIAINQGFHQISKP